MMTAKDKHILRELKERLEAVAGDRLLRVIAFGSRVWGEASPESDLDVAVVVRDRTPELDTALLEAAYQVMWDHDFTPLISLTILEAGTFEAYREQGYSFYRRVAREGVAV